MKYIKLQEGETKKNRYHLNPVKAFAVSFSFLTRFSFKPYESPLGSLWFFPVTGFLIGMVQAGVFLGINIFFSPLLSSLGAVAFLVWVTGGLHEDGLSDWADGVGAARKVRPENNRQARFSAMHDAKTGVFGTVSLIFAVLFRVVLIVELASWEDFIWAIAVSHAISRGILVVLMAVLPPAPESSLARSLGRPHRATVIFVLCASLCSFFFFSDLRILFFGLGIFLCAFFVSYFFLKRAIAGFSGDGLGASQQISEIFLLCGFLSFTQIGAFS